MLISDQQIDRSSTSIPFYDSVGSVKVATNGDDPSSAVSVGWFNDHMNQTQSQPAAELRYTLDEVKNAIAEEVKTRFGYTSGMSDLYREKYDQAVEFLASETVDENTFPLIKITAAWKNISLREAATCIIAARKKWLRFACFAEEVLLKTKSELEDSSDFATRSEIVSRAIQLIQTESHES